MQSRATKPSRHDTRSNQAHPNFFLCRCSGSAAAMETGGAAVRAADIPRASLTVVLVDSTGYGWLPGQKLRDAAMDFRKCGGVETVASIVSGVSIVKAGKKDGTNILDQFMQWVLDGGEETHGGDVEVEVGPRLRARGTV